MITYNGKVLSFGQYPNGESNLKHIRRDILDINHVVTLQYEGDADLFHLLLVRRELRDVSVTLRITYVPYSRMDRESDTYVFSLKVFTEFINAMNWERVVIYEPHSDVLPALLDRVQVINVVTSFQILTRVNLAVKGTYQVCYPDVGAFKRYSDKLKTPDPLIGYKVRDFETGNIVTLKIEGKQNSDNVVIFDDLCSKGGTFILAAEQLQIMGFKRIFLAVAHCEQTIFKGEVLTSGLIEKVITTDSILRVDSSDNLQVLPLARFGWA